MRVVCQFGMYAGRIMDYPDQTAIRLLKSGMATRIPGREDEGAAGVENATAEPESERAMEKKSGKKGRRR